MSTKAIYFPHFTNTLLDDKISKLRRKLDKDALSGYAIYFILLERLSTKTNYELEYTNDFLDDLAYELRCDPGLIKKVIEDFDLFVIDGDIIYSTAHKNNMQYFEDKKQRSSNGGKKSSSNMTSGQRSERASNAGKKRWDKNMNNNADPDSMLSDLASDANELESHAINPAD